MKKKNEKCGGCDFSLPFDPEQVLCRRFPPVPNLAVGRFVFPVMNAAGGWCGEYKPKTKGA